MGDGLISIIEGCKSSDRSAQEALYRRFYGYAMSLCLPYSKDKVEAEEMAQDGFMKVFTKIDQYNADYGFKSWLRRIFINCAIDHFRRHKKHHDQDDISEVQVEHFDNSAIDNLTTEEIMGAIQQLSPAYQMAFQLNVIEGYKHQEIADKLGITEATSRSNLAKARNKLKEVLNHLVQ